MSDPSDGEDVFVANAGAGRELRIGGTSASWYQPGRLLTGSVWDALAVPVCALEIEAPRILMLGLGGGSAARLLRAAAPDARIVGVELSADVVEAARAGMDLDALEVEVHVADAKEFLDRPGTYDLIVEDCFMGYEGGLTKPPWFLEAGVDAIRARLARGGVAVCDTIHERAWARQAYGARFASLVRIDLFDCTNGVLVASDRDLDARGLRRRVADHPVLADALGNLTFRTLQRASVSSTRSSS